MSAIKVKNKGNQIFIGKKLCPKGKVTPVDEKDLEAFCKTPGGSALIDVSLFVYSEDFKKQKAASSMALKQQAEATVRQELTPVIEKEIRAKLEKEYGKTIKSLREIILDLEKKLKTVDDLVSDDKPEPSKEFVFDPENHTIEHRGGGQYFVMDLEDNKVIDRAITKEEKEKFEAMQKAE